MLCILLFVWPREGRLGVGADLFAMEMADGAIEKEKDVHTFKDNKQDARYFAKFNSHVLGVVVLLVLIEHRSVVLVGLYRML